jgi:ADP-ribose pyrophosphatase YjhB (NUDIX family)
VRKVQRVAAYAVVIRDDRILLSRLAERLTTKELWTLPGGGLEHGEDPRDAVVREVHEETGLHVQIGETARVYSSHQRNTWRQGRRADAHSLRIVYDGWVPVDAPEPRVVEVDGSTVEAAWKPLADVLDGSVPTVALVTEVLQQHSAFQLQRVAAYALVVRDERVLLTRNSARGPHPGTWTLPGGGIDHGEDPRASVVREVREETGLVCAPGEVLDVTSMHFEGTAPSGRREDFHALQVVFGAAVEDGEPRVVEFGGTTDAAAWVPLAGLGEDREVRDLVHTALAARRRIAP